MLHTRSATRLAIMLQINMLQPKGTIRRDHALCSMLRVVPRCTSCRSP